MIPPITSKAIRTQKNIRGMRSLYTMVGPARGRWSRLREGEQIAQSEQNVQNAQSEQIAQMAQNAQSEQIWE